MSFTGSFGWAYIGQGLGGPNGAIQYRDGQGLAGSSKFTYDNSTDSVLITGSLEVSGAITANQFNVNIVNRTVSSIDVTGSTHFGDTSDDKHVFTGSVIAAGPLTASQYVSASTFYGLGTNLTAIDAGNITQGTLGNARLEQIIDRQVFSGSVAVSGAVGRFGYLTGTIDASNLVGTIDNARLPSIIDVSYVTASTAITSPDAKFTSISGTIVQASQPQITSLGTLENLSITGDLNVDSPTLKVDSAGDKVGIGVSAPAQKFEVLKQGAPQVRLAYRQYGGMGTPAIHTDFETLSDGSLKISNTGQKLIFTGSTAFSGNLDVTDTITAQVVDVYQLRVTGTLSCFTGSTRFGDLSTDTHTYTGSVHYAGPIQLNSNLTASGHVSASLYYGDGSNLSGIAVQTYSTAGDNRLLTSVNSDSIQGESSLTFDGSILDVDGAVSGSKFTDGTGSFEAGSITGLSSLGATTVTATNLGGTLSTAAQPNVTSVGTLTSLAISGDLTIDSPTLKVDSAGNKVGIGLTNPAKSLEILNDSDAQLRLSYQKYTGLGTNNIYSDFRTLSDGTLKVSTYNNKIWLNGATNITGNLEVSGSGKIIGDLEVTGTLTAKLTNFQVSADSLVFGDNSADSLVFSASSVQTPNGLDFDSGTLYISASNNRVGIGTTSPTAQLTIDDSATPAISFATDGTDRAGLFSGTGGSLVLSAGGASNYHMILKSDGKLGIGTASPNFILDVQGSTGISQNLEVTGAVTASSFTDETIVISSGTLTGAGMISTTNLSATSLTGTLITAAQANITSLGTLTSLTVNGLATANSLTVDGDTLFVSASNDRVGVGTLTPRRTLDIKNEDGYQLRLTNQQTSFPMNEVYTDFSVNDAGNLLIAPYGGGTFLSGNLEVSGTVYANELVTNIVNKNVVEISATGSTKFGDTTDDLHQFTGSLDVSGAAYVNDLYVAGVAYGGSPFKVSGGLNVLEGDVNVTSGQISADNVNVSNLNITGSGTNLISGSIQISGSILPNGNEMHDLGAPGVHWRNIYCGDFHLKNDRGSWTIVEEEDYLSLRNNKTGKLFKFVLQEIT